MSPQAGSIFKDAIENRMQKKTLNCTLYATLPHIRDICAVIFWSEICVNYSPRLNNFSEMPLEESEVLLQHFIPAEQPDKLGLVVGLWVSNLVSVWAFKYSATFCVFICVYIFTQSLQEISFVSCSHRNTDILTDIWLPFSITMWEI